MNDSVLHYDGEFESHTIAIPTPVSYSNHFKCPSCSGDIYRYIINENRPNSMSYISVPTCKDCRREYTINIAEDLSYEITPN